MGDILFGTVGSFDRDCSRWPVTRRREPSRRVRSPRACSTTPCTRRTPRTGSARFWCNSSGPRAAAARSTRCPWSGRSGRRTGCWSECSVYGANTPLGSRTIVCRLNSFSSSSLIRAHTPSPKSVPFGQRPRRAPAGRQRRRLAVQLAHDELEEEQRRLGGLPVLGKVALDAPSPPRRRTAGWSGSHRPGPARRSR